MSPLCFSSGNAPHGVAGKARRGACSHLGEKRTRHTKAPLELALFAIVSVASVASCRGAPAQPTSGNAQGDAAEALEPAPSKGPEFVRAGEGDAAEVVRDAMDRAEADGRRLVVYVGADWCEPCKRFHAAADAGTLDDAFPDLRLLEFDATIDQTRLAEGGYASRLVPLFCLPDAHGRGTDRRIEGSIKGDGAVANITPRLQALLADGEPR